MELLWYLRLYPRYLNKKMVKFYCEYLKQELGSNVSNQVCLIGSLANDKMIRKYKINGLVMVENIVCLLIAKLAL